VVRQPKGRLAPDPGQLGQFGGQLVDRAHAKREA
jgi:hypothetical protein